MIINSKQYSGPCSCGREHDVVTQAAIVEAGCLARADAYLSEYGIEGFRVVIYDRNTYHAEGMVHMPADREVILDPDGLHANEKGVALLLEQLPEQAQVLVAVGSGTVHDITRYCAYLKELPFVSCPTAASVDGYCSSVAAMTWEGAKKTLTAVAPRMVLADLNVISKAPIHLARSGFGDMIGKYIALADWRIAHALTGEFYCSRIADIMAEATQAVLESSKGIAAGEEAAFETLTYGLLLSGIAMQMMGNSRPASGGEHHISHFIEMGPDGLEIHSDALHGEKVGVGTILAAAEYHRLAELPAESWGDYPDLGREEVYSVFGERLCQQVLDENRTDCAAGIKGDQIRSCLDRIRSEIGTIPSADTLKEAYEQVGAMKTLCEISVPEELTPQLLDDSPMVRNRLTLMRLRRCLKRSGEMEC